MNKKNQNAAAEPRENALLGFAYWQKNAVGTRVIRFKWGKIFLLSLLLAAGAWLAASAALYGFLKYAREYESVRFTDMFTLPFRLDEHRKEMGTYHIEKGMRIMEEVDGNTAEGFRLLRLGLARNPGHLEARKLCASIFASFNPDKAIQVLERGLHAHGGTEDTEYLNLTIDLMKRLQHEEELLQLAEQLLGAEGTNQAIRKKLANTKIEIHILHGSYDLAKECIEQHNLGQTLDGFLFLAQIEEAKGEIANQIYYLKQALEAGKESERYAYLIHETSSAYLQLGNTDQALQLAIFLGHHLPFARIHHHNGEREAEDAQIKRMILNQGDDSDARLQLAAYAAETGNPELAVRAYELAAIDAEPLQPFIISLIQARLKTDDFAGALEDIEAVFSQDPDWLDLQRPFLQGFRAVSAYGLYRPDLGDIYLEDYRSAYAGQPALILNIAMELSRIGQKEEALQLLETGLHFAPNHPQLLAEAIDLSIGSGSYGHLEERLQRYLALRRPDKAFARRALNAVKLNRHLTGGTSEDDQLTGNLQDIIGN